MSDIPDPELFRRTREQKLRTASGPASSETLMPKCLRGLIRADHDDHDDSCNDQATRYPEA